jgi:putative tricarboxylic transport membrane protein
MKRFDVAGIGPYAVVLLVSVVLFYETLGITPAGDGKLGADVWPKSVLILAMITCVWEILRRIRGRLAHGARGRDDRSRRSRDAGGVDDAAPAAGIAPWIGIGLTAAYVFAFPWLGYFLATLFYVIAFVYVGNFRRPFIAAAIGLAAAFGFMLLFMRIVYVSLPIGVEPFARLSTFLMGIMGIK